MKYYLFALFFIILFFQSNKGYSQEEFFGNHAGLSPFYQRGLNQNTFGYGASAYLKKGIALGIGIEQIETQSISTLSMIFFTRIDKNRNGVRFAFGPSYSYMDPYNIIGFNFGILRVFFPESNFPFSPNLSTSFSIPFTKNGFSNQNSRTSFFEPVFVVGCGFTQAFFAKQKVYPIINISTGYNMHNNINLLSGAVGLNIKL
jgi:hypothetical protein